MSSILSIPRRTTKPRQAAIALVTLWLFLLQAIVPTGYMPAGLLSEGSLVKLCPSGVSDSVMAILHKGHGQPLNKGRHGDHSEHAHHHHHGHHADSAELSVLSMEHDEVWENNCVFGFANPADELILSIISPAVAGDLAGYKQQLLLSEAAFSKWRRKQLSRAPPNFA